METGLTYQLHQEKYKWGVLNQVYSKWNWNAEDIPEMYKNAFIIEGKRNLWESGNFYPTKHTLWMFENFKEETINEFDNLFNEEIELKDRIKNFIKFYDSKLPELQSLVPDKKINYHSHKDFRAIALYLTLQYPEKYFLYKFTMFKNFSLKLELPKVKAGDYNNLINFIDLSNEVDAVITRGGFDRRWSGAGRMLCQWRSYIQKFNSFSKTPVTFSLRLHALVLHPLNLLSDQGPMACADYFDFHSYEDSGKIHRCKQMRQYAGLKKKPLILGEFGQGFFNHRYDNDLQMRNTATYLASAKSCGFSEALAWRLSDNRPGFNKEARYSFEAFGVMRPAYELIKAHNETLLLHKLK